MPSTIAGFPNRHPTAQCHDAVSTTGYGSARASDLIAVVGMGCRLPGGITNPSELWEFLLNKRTGRRDFDLSRISIDGYYHSDYHRPGSINTRGAYLLDEDPYLFDHAFFGINPTEVGTMDPMQRKLLEVVYEAFENAGEPLEKFSGSRTGVFVGNFNIDHHIMQMHDADFQQPYAPTGGSSSILSNRVNYLFNLRGPSLTVDTACSSSMYALHLAVKAIQNGDCEAAVVGGTNLILSPEMQQLTVKLGALSPSSTCHTFDESADGYGRAEGITALYLRMYSDAIDGNYPIRAIIRGTGINSNGGRTPGISHPSVDGQEDLIRRVYQSAGISTSLTGYFECHGTGTPVGDPAEISAIDRVFASERQGEPLLIGSVKTNLGHSEPASGITGVIKAILSLENGIIPPTIGVERLNPNIDFEAAKVRVVTDSTPWPRDLLRRVSVNSFGYGGANGHCIIDHVSVLQSETRRYASMHTESPYQIAIEDTNHPNESNNYVRRKLSLDGGAQRTTYGVSRNGSSGDIPNESDGVADYLTSGMDHSGGNRVSHLDVNRTTETTKADFSHPPSGDIRRLVLLPISAQDSSSLERNTSAIIDILSNYPLSDLAYTLSGRRSRYSHRSFAVIDSRTLAVSLHTKNLISAKASSAHSPRLCFVFTGQGAQWQDMGRTLFEYGIFRESIRLQEFVLRSLSFPPPWSLTDILSGASNVSIQEPEISQTICTALQIALVDLLRLWNVLPSVSVGHSSGEIAAAYSAGRISLASAITAAYCRGKSITQNVRLGLMLAVGLDRDTASTYLEGIESKVNIAAINSPMGVTLSGDTDAIKYLERQLKSKKIFAKILSTGKNAYHSHHMTGFGKGYEDLLLQAFGELELGGILDDSRQYPQTRWMSSVTPEKAAYATARYWRENLESPVQFSDAIEKILVQPDMKPDIVIEIGPHSALQSPLKQIFAKHEEGGMKSPVYLPTLRRLNDGMQDLLNLCGSLFCLNAEVDLVMLNSVERIENDKVQHVHGKVCVDLPTYRYSYGPKIHYENRIAREIRLRKYLHHDLIGVRQAGSSKDSPSWRNILKLKDVPWLKDHKLLPHPVMPGSAYVCMAIEAVSQFLDLGTTFPDQISLQLRNVAIKSPMRIPEDEMGIEVMLNLQASSKLADWFEFRVSSYSQDEDAWTDHANGLIKASLRSGAMTELNLLNEGMDMRAIEMGDWQEKFKDVGLGYGPAFQGLSDLHSDPGKGLATANVALNTTHGMFNGPESRYSIHPSSLDLCHQLALIAAHGGQVGQVKSAFIPVQIDEMRVWPQRSLETFGRGIASAEFKGLRGAHAKIQLFSSDGSPIVEIAKLRCVAYNGDGGKKQRLRQPSPYTRLVWKPDISTLTFANARRIFPPTVAIDQVQTIFDKMNEMAVLMILELAHCFESRDSSVLHIRRFQDWVKNSVKKLLPSVEGKMSSSEGRKAKIEALYQQVAHVADAKHTKRIYDSMTDIINGTTSGLQIATQDNLLEELYTSSLGIKAAYPQLERLLDLLSHRNPQMKIIEVGAGTGSATRVALRALGADTDSKRYSQYVFTDVSPAFFGPAQAKFAAYKGLSYQTLDINLDPLQQGLEAELDLVIASQALHTAKSIEKSLRNIRKLLKPGGKMILLETTRPWTGHNLAYGTFPDWWPDDGNKDSPFLSVEEWNNALHSTGFSGIDIELDDYPEPAKTVSTILTTSVEHCAPTALDITSPRKIVFIVCHSTSNGVAQNSIATELRNRGFDPQLAASNLDQIPNNSCVIVTQDLDAHTLIDGTEENFKSIKLLVARASDLLWLTCGGLIDGRDPKSAVATGLIRMLITENPLNGYGIFHLQSDADLSNPNSAKHIVDHFSSIIAGEPDCEVALYNGSLHISRLIPDTDLNKRFRLIHSNSVVTEELPIHNGHAMSVDFETPGLLSTAYFKEDTSFVHPLPPNYIEVQTAAIGLNWKDLAVSAGRLDIDTCSSECAGTVLAVGSCVTNVKPGDKVFALAWGKFGTRMRVPAVHAQVIQGQSFQDAATLPIGFCTAIYALNHVARLRKGESVLIQSATGGLGLIAIQIAQSIGAKIFATVGSEEKAQYLVESCGLSRDRIFSSRDPHDIRRQLSASEGRGFNVILSSSSGEMMHETFRQSIAPRGRFIDVGRVDVQNHGSMAMEIFERNATFSSFDLSTMAIQDVEFCGELMQEAGEMLRAGKIKPLPYKSFNISELDKAMLYFSKGKHIGKVVVSYEDQASLMIPPSPYAKFDSTAEYLLVGGLGGLGRSILQWMVSRGARHLTVLSRSGTKKISPEAAAMIASLDLQDVHIQLVACDITVKTSLSEAIQTLSHLRPIKGILHAAVSFLDQPFDTLPYSQWEGGLSAKVQGTINLHELSIEHDLSLDFFIMTSSFEAVVALPTQAAYCAANSFQDAFARYRRAQGLPAASIAFGLITEIGDVGQRDATRHMIHRNGLYRTGELGFLRLLEAAFLESPQPTQSWYNYDPLAEAQITTCLDPSELAEMASQVQDGAPRWHSDAKFLHLLQAMNDHMGASDRPLESKSGASTILSSIDNAIASFDIPLAVDLIADAVMQRTATLLMISFENMEAGKSIAEYGVDSLIAVELRNWIAVTWETNVPLLVLLDERLSIRKLADGIVDERREKLLGGG
ncbi:polyketide synthase [Lojkania enalia]|uniref:Polyketide synthase n=1 Tax=Lojkania enalia TaxID=147567 RepID=A0A9P4KAS7_9PLEO|nr:polyketide synthase [Didymosphaeria enalia]